MSEYLHLVFEEIASKYPEKYLDVTQTITFSIFNKQANKLARFFRLKFKESRVPNKPTIAILMPTSMEYILTQMAILKAGFAVLSLTTNRDESSKRLLDVINDPDCVAIVTTTDMLNSRFLREVRQVHPDWLIDDIENIKCQCNTLEEDNLGLKIEASELAYKAYSSGSTGAPKKALITHRGILNCMRTHQRVMEMSCSDVMAVLADTVFDAHWVEIYTPLTIGAQIRIIPQRDKLSLHKYKHFYTDVTVAVFTTEMLLRLNAEDFPQLRTIISTGDILTDTIKNKWSHCLLIDGYGPMEVTIATYLKKKGEMFLIDGLQLHLCPFDEDTWQSDVNKTISPNDSQLGEIYITGDGLAQGYSSEAMTKEKFVHIPDPKNQNNKIRAFKTGDLAKWCGNELQILGRVDRQFKIHGKQIHASEIEAVVKEFDQNLTWCFVDAIKLKSGHLRLFAYIYHQQCFTNFNYLALSRYIQSHKNSAMVPAHWYQLSSIPDMSTNLKINREILAKLVSKKFYSQGIHRINTKDTILGKLVEIWQNVLELGNDYQPCLDDDFFVIGGTSLQFVDFIDKLNSNFSVKILPHKVGRDTSIGHFFRFIKRMQNDSTRSKLIELVPHRLESSEPPWIIIHSLLGDAVNDFHQVVAHWSSQRGVYAINARGLTDSNDMDEIVEQIADDYINAILKRFPSSPYLIAGYSAGGLIGMAMVGELKRRGHEVVFLMLDSMSFDYYQSLSYSEYAAFIFDLYTKKLSSYFHLDNKLIESVSDGFSSKYPELQIQEFFEIIRNQSDNRYHGVIATIRGLLLAIYRYRQIDIPDQMNLWYATQTAPDKQKSAKEQLHWREVEFAETLALPGDHFSILFDIPKAAVLARAMDAFARYKLSLSRLRSFQDQLRNGYQVDLAHQIHDKDVATLLSDTQVFSKQSAKDVKTQYVEGSLAPTRALVQHSLYDEQFVNAFALNWANAQVETSQYDLVFVLRLSTLVGRKKPFEKSRLNLGQLVLDTMPVDTTGIVSSYTERELTDLLSQLLFKILWVINDDRVQMGNDSSEKGLCNVVDDLWTRHLTTQMIMLSNQVTKYEKGASLYTIDSATGKPLFLALDRADSNNTIASQGTIVSPNSTNNLTRHMDFSQSFFQPNDGVTWNSYEPQIQRCNHYISRVSLDGTPLHKIAFERLQEKHVLLFFGPAGSGKSSFVNSLFTLYSKEYMNRVLHFDYSSPQSLTHSRITIMRQLNIDTLLYNPRNPDSLIVDKLMDTPKTMLIMDTPGLCDTDTPETYYRNVGLVKKHHFVVMARRAESTEFETIEIPCFSSSESLAFLKKVVVQHYTQNASDIELLELASLLGHHPLSLVFAAHTVGKYKPVRVYIDEYRTSYKRRKAYLSSDKFSSISKTSPYVAWDNMLKYLQNSHSQLIPILSLTAFYSTGKIPIEYFTMGTLAVEEVKLDDIIRELFSFSLITINWVSKSFIVHTTLQEVMRLRFIEEENYTNEFEKAYKQFISVFTYQRIRRENIDLNLVLLEHGFALLENATFYNQNIPEKYTITLKILLASFVLYEQRDSKKAITLLEGIKDSEKQIEINTILSFAYMISGQYMKAFLLCRDSIQLYLGEAEHSSEVHLHMAFIFNTLGHLYAVQGKLHWEKMQNLEFLQSADVFYTLSCNIYDEFPTEASNEGCVAKTNLVQNCYYLYLCEADSTNISKIATAVSLQAQQVFNEYGNQHVNALHFRCTLAEIAYFQEKQDLMISEFNKILSDAKQVLHPDANSELATIHRRYGCMLLRSNKLTEAFEQLKMAEVIRSQKFGNEPTVDSIPTVLALQNVTSLLKDENESRKYMKQLVELRRLLNETYGTHRKELSSYVKQFDEIIDLINVKRHTNRCK